LHQIADAGVSPSIKLKLISHKIVFEEFQPDTVPERHGQTDGQTDGQTTYCGIIALCVASRGKNDDNIQIFTTLYTVVNSEALNRFLSVLSSFHLIFYRAILAQSAVMRLPVRTIWNSRVVTPAERTAV